MDGDWAHLARTLARARKVRGLTQAQLASQLGVGLSTVQKMERPGVAWVKISPTHRLAASLYGWTERSIEAVLDGGEPVLEDGAPTVPSAVTADQSQAAFDTLTAGMSDRAVEALRRGRTVDTRVVEVSGGQAQAVMIFKADMSDVSPEERARYMRKWDLVQRAATEIFSDEE